MAIPSWGLTLLALADFSVAGSVWLHLKKRQKLHVCKSYLVANWLRKHCCLTARRSWGGVPATKGLAVIVCLVSFGTSSSTRYHPSAARPRMNLTSCSWLIALLTMANNITTYKGLVTSSWSRRQTWRLLFAQANPLRTFQAYTCSEMILCLLASVNVSGSSR